MSFNSSSFGNMKMQYKEKWNSAGSLTYVAFKDNGSSTWQTMSGTEPGSDDAYAESDYDSQGYTVSVKNSSDNSSFYVNGSYHIALEDPSSKPEAIIGYGEIIGVQDPFGIIGEQILQQLINFMEQTIFLKFYEKL